MKRCHTCKTDKDLSNFNKNKSRKDGLNSICKDCSKERSKRYYSENTALHKANVIKNKMKYRQEIQKKVTDYLITHPCVDCGMRDIRTLEFDHLDPTLKEFNISTALRSIYSWERILIEIQKCDVVCANCHKIRTCIAQKWYKNKV